MKAPSAHTRVALVIGDPVAHSMSPAIHNAAFAAAGIDAVYAAMQVAPSALPVVIEGLRSMGVLGVSVTIPHKEAVLKLCDRLEEPARSIGAVNCLSFEADGAMVGHNTDAGGFVDALAEVLGVDPSGKRVVLLGAGGAARAIASGLQLGGAAGVTAIARSPEKVSWIEARPWTESDLAETFDGADLVVDCTSRSLSDTEAPVPASVPLDALHDGAAVVSLVYHRKSEILVRAEERGLMVADGAGMLVHQGARAFRLWTGQDAPVEAMWAALGT